MRPIAEIAARLGLRSDDWIPFGHDKAKVRSAVLERPPRSGGRGRLVLVSAMTPTPAGEGKTTCSIGLAQALDHLGHSVCLALREPSLGPVFGIKGGGTGGGRAVLVPTADINLHCTGDLHAITAAHNLLAAVVDNHLHFDQQPRLDPNQVVWPRVMDMNERALRAIVCGLGDRNGVPRQAGFDITAASELMAILCLAEDAADLRARIDRIVVGYTHDGEPVRAAALGATGAMMALLRDALLPNLVQTGEGTPALVHGGPFANIAHGCNSVLATRMAQHLADWAITEAGFGFDLGAEKFFDIKCAQSGLRPDAVVLVATARALKLHGGVKRRDLATPDPTAVQAGLPNLARHIESARRFGHAPIIAINRFADDAPEELAVIRAACAEWGVRAAVCTHFEAGGPGAVELARALLETVTAGAPETRLLYTRETPFLEKVERIVRAVYGGEGVVLTRAAKRDLKRLTALGYADLPVCIAKTQNSLSDNARLRGRPTGFTVTVRGVRVNAGAGFLVVLTGDIMRMPGLPRRPAAGGIDLVDGVIVGVS